jgi:hypothetical protein
MVSFDPASETEGKRAAEATTTKPDSAQCPATFGGVFSYKLSLLNGDALARDERVSKCILRERRLLTVYEPDRDFIGAFAFAQLALTYCRRVLMTPYFWFLLACYIVPLLGCSLSNSASLEASTNRHFSQALSAQFSSVSRSVLALQFPVLASACL